MDDTAIIADAPAGWLEALARSDADIAAGRLVSGEEVMRLAREAIARLEARPQDKAPAL